METIYLIGSIQAFFLDLLLVNKKQKSRADVILIVWLFLIGLHILFFYLRATGFRISFTIAILNAAFPLLQGPFLYLYARLLIAGKTVSARTVLPHILPFAVFALLGFTTDLSLLIYFLIPSVIISGMIYISVTFLMLRNYQKDSSPNHPVKVQWLMNLSVGLGIIWVCMVIIGITGHLLLIPIHHPHDLAFVLVSLVVFIISYFALKQGAVFATTPTAEGHIHPKTKYAQSGLKAGDLTDLQTRMKQYMEEFSPYTNPALNLQDIAQALEVPPHYISQLLNLHLNTNFYEFLNTYRVARAKEMMGDPAFDHLTVLGIGFECGFNSKATFNRAFKKIAGMTPGQYKKSLIR